MPRTDVTKNYIRKRKKNPKYFDKRSFRTKQVNSKTKIIVGCKKGKYSAKNKRCKVGLELQSVLEKRK